MAMEKVNEALFAQARQGESSALSTLYRRFLPAVFGYMALRVPDRTTAEDLTSEVFLQMVEGIHQLKAEDEARFVAWLLRIARVTVAGYYRKRARQPVQIATEAWEATLLSSLPDDLAHRIEMQETWQSVVQAVNRLTEEQRLVLVGRFFLDYDTDTIARLLGKKNNAVKALQFRALQRLRRLLGKPAHTFPWQGQRQHVH